MKWYNVAAMKKSLALVAVGATLMALSGPAAGAASCGLAPSCKSADCGLDLPRAEFARYYRAITGKDAPDGIVKFGVDPQVSKSGRDAYRIVTTASGQRQGVIPAPAVTITGSNLRSVWYGLYDLLERRGGCHWFWDGDVVPKRDSKIGRAHV